MPFGRRLLPVGHAMLVLLSTTACSTFVSLTDAGANVNLITPAAAENCTRMGRVSAVTRDNVVGALDRNSDRVKAELLALARNEAATMGADSVVATSEIEDGRQTFDAMRCGS